MAVALSGCRFIASDAVPGQCYRFLPRFLGFLFYLAIIYRLTLFYLAARIGKDRV
jgi:hypothetical protein